MGDDNVFHRIKRTHTLPRCMRDAHVVYTIAWQKVDSIVLPIHMNGKSEFLFASNHSLYKAGEGIVEWMYDKRETIDAIILDNMCEVDPRVFHRKGAALLNDVWSILFLKTEFGILEHGFEQPHEAREALSYLVLNTTDKLPQQKIPAELVVPASMANDPEGDILLYYPGGSSQNLRCNQPLSPSKPLKEPLVSAGSAGHPHCCNLPCKFAWKTRGCKDGAECTRCHLCRFVPFEGMRKRRRRRMQAQPQTFKF